MLNYVAHFLSSGQQRQALALSLFVGGITESGERFQ